MTSLSQSSTSSPDVLGPEGDALYLISSPAPPFTGRQSWVPPYTFHTHRRQERAPRRTPRRTPNQSSQKMRLNEIVLPSSPQMRQRSGSPTKMQSEGNLSPWRIRVTVEAEPEDEQNAQGGPRKKLKPSTVTTKVPLKDEESNPPSSKKRRGRPRKSDMREQSLSPIKGSPGHTPKLQALDSVKRPRGRPRKSLQSKEVAQSIEATGVSAMNTTRLDTFDGALDGGSPSPSVTTDVRSPSNASSDLDPFLDIAGGGGFEPSPHLTPDRLTPRVASYTPEPESERPTRVVEGTQQTTPRGIASPLGNSRGISPENTLHAGHTPRPRRSYPTPTSSSLVDGIGEKSTIPIQQNGSAQKITDPTNMHHEYDTIMESEDFSMVSLETLPSAKQAGLSSILSSTKGSLKPFVERQNAVFFDKSKARASKSPHESISHKTASSTSTPHSRPARSQDSYDSPNDQVVPVAINMASTSTAVSEAPEQPGTRKQTKRFSLAQLVRLGLSLHGVLSYEQHQDIEDSEEKNEEIANARDRLEDLFEDFDAGSQRQLRAGLRFGELIARHRVENRKPRKQEEAEAGAEEEDEEEEEGEEEEEEGEEEEGEEDEEEEEEDSKSVSERSDSSEHDSIGSPQQQKSYQEVPVEQQVSKSQQAEEEWQRERERVSRQIDEAGPGNVIVLESDEDIQTQSESDAQEDIDVESEDDFDDVWQEEARNHDSSLNRHRTLQASQSEARSTAPRNVASGNKEHGDLQTDYVRRGQLYEWDPSRGEIPPLGRSRMAQIRDEEVDLSLLLRPRDTPKSRKYYGNSSPRSILSQKLHSNGSLKHGVPALGASSPAERSLLRSSLVNEESKVFLSDRIVGNNEIDREDSMAEEEDETEKEEEYKDDMYILDEKETTQEEPSSFHQSAVTASTPEHAVSGPKQSWFRRITNNFTPGWWTASKRGHIDETGVPLDESQSPPFNANSSERQSQTPSLKRSRMSAVDAEEEQEELTQTSPVYSEEPQSKKHRYSSSSSSALSASYVSLPTSGYFTDAHYAAMKRLYWQARRSPERFPYHSTKRRDAMLGDSLWTSDGEHGLPIAEIQFGIIDRFVSDLTRADIRNGVDGEVGWSEDDLHKRLFSIIVGEQIRRERRQQKFMHEALL